ncbi:hypothetical protein R1sor_017878 [Riccia sorocarpa]|uniref:DNAJ heat shock N-terminal domain-containing protein n=1 Tax=Riccia sorocarpa TaxID=122646 RepID=A0ABD3I974_9MARC
MAVGYLKVPRHTVVGKNFTELCSVSSMNSASALPCGSDSCWFSVRSGGFEEPLIARVRREVWRNSTSSRNKSRETHFSIRCACALGNASYIGTRPSCAVSASAAVAGGLSRLKSTYGRVFVNGMYETKRWERNKFHSSRVRAKLGGDEEVDINGDVVADDYYSVLGLTPDATQEEIKRAYYSCMKACHPDLTGNDPSVTNFCSFINEVYEVLSDPEQRLIYDEINGYTLTATNPFNDRNAELEYSFVDEFSCIGCKNCAHTAPESFEIEEEYGRARVFSQSGDPVLVERAIQTCPVDCIYWISAQQLTLLEDEMRRVERVNVGLMLAGMGEQTPDVFARASRRWEKRQARAVERARIRMMKESGKNGKDAWWKVNWGSTADEKSSKEAADKYAKERAAKAAAASRRWREYSRRGVDRRAVRILAAETAAKAQEEADKKKAGIN